jgi:hypothetical protein
LAYRLEEPESVHLSIVSTYFATKRFIVRHFLLPRPYWARVKLVSEEADPETGKYHLQRYFSHPWYIKPTLASRWGFDALRTRFLWGGVVPGAEGEKYHPGGYDIRDVGPEGLQGKGKKEMEITRQRLRERAKLGGCPMTIV